MKKGLRDIKEWFLDEGNAKRYWIISLLVLAFNTLFFYVIAESGFSADDIYNSQSRCMAYIAGDNVWSTTYRIFREWLDAGRFFPFSDYTYILFYYVQSRLAYKLLIMLSVFICAFLFGKCIDKLTKSKITGIATFALFPLCIQLTGAFDSALYCFHMLVQMTFIWSLLSLLCVLTAIDKYRERKAGNAGKGIWAYYILSGVFLFMSLGTYETAFVLFAFVALAVWGYTGKFFKACLALIPDFVSYGIACIINVVIRMNMPDVGYDGIAINLNVADVLRTFAKQVFGTLPSGQFIYSVVKGEPMYGKSELIGMLRLSDVLMVIVFAVMVFVIINVLHHNIEKVKNVRFMVLGGVSLIVFPALLISITTKYQQELSVGTSHISAFIQSFGLVSLVLAVIIAILRRFGKKSVNIIIAVLLVVNIPIMLVQEMESRCSVYYMNFSYRYPMENIAAAGEAGIFDDIEPEDEVLGISEHYYDVTDGTGLYTRAAKSEIPIIAGDLRMSAIQEWNAEYLDKNDVYAVNSVIDADRGEVVVAHITSCVVRNADNEDYDLMVDSFKIYSSYEDAHSLNYVENGMEKSISLSEIQPIYEKGDSRMYEIEGTGIDVDTIVIGR